MRNRRSIRPELIIISKRGRGSYTAILRRLKLNPELGRNVSLIKRSHEADFVLELKGFKDIIVD